MTFGTKIAKNFRSFGNKVAKQVRNFGDKVIKADDKVFNIVDKIADASNIVAPALSTALVGSGYGAALAPSVLAFNSGLQDVRNIYAKNRPKDLVAKVGDTYISKPAVINGIQRDN